MKINNPRLEGMSNNTQEIENVTIKMLNIRDRHGVEVPTSCVEFTVVGKRNGRKWRDFLTMEEFAESNPGELAELINNN